jgi:peptidoglycan hydrolase-like amidase
MELALKEDIYSNTPVLEICIFEGQNQVDFKYLSHDFDIYDLDNNLIEADFKKEHLCRIKIKEATPSQFEYFIILHESENLDYIKNKTRTYKKNLKKVFYREVGGDIVSGKKTITNNRKYLCLVGPFKSEEEAKFQLVEYGELNHCRIHKKKKKDGKILLEMFDPDGENVFEFNSAVKLIPKNISAEFELHHLHVNKIVKRRQIYENLFYQGGLVLSIDSNGKLSGINIVAVEDYIKGVLLSEISSDVTKEFAKTMAVVCRSNVYARYGHRHYEESFDFCNDGHCMRYFGKDFANGTIKEAVSETENMVLAYKDIVCDSFYSYSCGGHTDTVDGVWLRDDAKYLSGRIDTGEKIQTSFDLTKEEDVKKWVLGRPDVYCNLISQPPPASMPDGATSFRWEVFYTREELHSIIKEKTGEDVGLIYELIPVERSVSGRIKEIQILGSLKNITIKGELNIRSALSASQLRSSCFIVESEMDGDGVPYNFTLIGCGVGHGIGLCKVGAAVMAQNGKNYTEILKHYYEKCHIKRIEV